MYVRVCAVRCACVCACVCVCVCAGGRVRACMLGDGIAHSMVIHSRHVRLRQWRDERVEHRNRRAIILCARACVRVCVRASVCACVCVRVRACECVCVRASM
jgi:hypothetical protein